MISAKTHISIVFIVIISPVSLLMKEYDVTSSSSTPVVHIFFNILVMLVCTINVKSSKNQTNTIISSISFIWTFRWTGLSHSSAIRCCPFYKCNNFLYFIQFRTNKYFCVFFVKCTVSEYFYQVMASNFPFKCST